eukprot:scaffold46581_cov21-Tisochrysis_lutea.AAC.1
MDCLHLLQVPPNAGNICIRVPDRIGIVITGSIVRRKELEMWKLSTKGQHSRPKPGLSKQATVQARPVIVLCGGHTCIRGTGDGSNGKRYFAWKAGSVIASREQLFLFTGA